MNQVISSENSEQLAADTALVREYLDRAVRPAVLDAQTQESYKRKITQLMRQKKARLVAHYYTDSVLQDLAEETGGFVGDSLEMARFGRDCDAEILIVAGVKFMGESAKILSPEKTVIMPTLEATCSLDIACPIDKFSAFCDQAPGSYRCGLCEYIGGCEGPCGLGRYLQHCAGCSRALDGTG